jgi:ribosomal protein L24
VRVKRGPLKGDLAKVLHLLEGSSKAIVQVLTQVIRIHPLN